MKYKIYRLTKNNGNQSGEIMKVIEDEEFQYEEFDTQYDAYEALKNRGNDYSNYTILPYIYMSESA